MSSLSESQSFKCLHCGSAELCFGYQGTSTNVFVPSGTFTFHGYKTRAYVCLKCGVMGHYIPKNSLLKMKDKLSSRFTEGDSAE